MSNMDVKECCSDLFEGDIPVFSEGAKENHDKSVRHNNQPPAQNSKSRRTKQGTESLITAPAVIESKVEDSYTELES